VQDLFENYEDRGKSVQASGTKFIIFKKVKASNTMKQLIKQFKGR
jgi:hypothetical protein